MPVRFWRRLGGRWNAPSSPGRPATERPWPPDSHAIGHTGSSYDWDVASPRHPVVKLSAPSRDEYVAFSVDLDIGFTHTGRLPDGTDPFLIACNLIEKRVAEVSRNYPLTATAQLRTELETVLAWQRSDPQSGVSTWAHCADVGADEQLQHAIRTKEASERALAVLRWKQNDCREQVRFYLDLLADPARATSWWLSSHTDSPERLPEMVTLFTTVKEQLNPQRGQEDIADVVREFLDRTPREITPYYLRHLEQLTLQHAPELTARVRAISGGAVDGKVGSEDGGPK